MGSLRRAERASVRRALGITLGFIASKSLLASKQGKEAVERRLGPRMRNGLYRPLYVVYSVVGAVLVVREVYRPPHSRLYEAPAPLRHLMRAGQLASLAATIEATRVIGPGFFGVPQVRALLGRGEPEAEPEAQGPPSEDGEMSRRSIFGVTRHPNNWFPTMLFLLEPRMTNKRAMFCALVVAHGLLGSVHEEYRLRAQYGVSPYERYAQAVPFLVSLPRRGAPPPAAPTTASGPEPMTPLAQAR